MSESGRLVEIRERAEDAMLAGSSVARRLRDDVLWLLARLETAERRNQELEAGSGGDGWSAVVSSAAQATPGAWYFDGRDIFSEQWPNHDGHRLVFPMPQGWDGKLSIRAEDCVFVVALVNWFFARSGEAGGTTAPAHKPEPPDSGSLASGTHTEDAATVREALLFMRNCGDRPGMYDTAEDALDALGRLVAAGQEPA